MLNRTRQVALCCVPVVLALAAFAAPAGAASVVTISPLAGAPAAMPETQISFLGAAAPSLSSISVVGSRSGRHAGHLRSYSSATGASFLPNTPFTPGENVTVRALWRVGRSTHAIGTHFKVAVPVAPPSTEFPPVPAKPGDVQSFLSEPALHPPTVSVHQAAGAASAPGYLFAAPFIGPGQWGPMIFDSAGNLVWFRAMPAGEDAADFQTQVYHGKNDLTWWQGKTIILGYGLGEDVIANANYRTVAVVKAGNGLPTDEHEFSVLPNGAALVTRLRTRAGRPLLGRRRRRRGRGQRRAAGDRHPHRPGHVGVAQPRPRRARGRPTPNPLPSPATTSTTSTSTRPGADSEGNFLISARNTWALYDLNGHTGADHLAARRQAQQLRARRRRAVRLPAQRADAAQRRDLPVRRRGCPARQRALARRAHQAEHQSQDRHARRPAGALARRCSPTARATSRRCPAAAGWSAGAGCRTSPNSTPRGSPSTTPSYPPARTATASTACRGRGSRPNRRRSPRPPQPAPHAVYASWNGATTVASWQLLTGASASQMTPVSTTPKGGFQTVIPAPAAAFYEVRALSPAGRVLGTSKAVAPTGG